VDYKELDVWKQAMQLVEDVDRLTRALPAEELYGLTSQLRRCAVSIPSNLAEGSARRSPREFAHFLTVALGSLAELETQLLISHRLGYCNADLLLVQANRVRALLLGIRSRQTSR